MRRPPWKLQLRNFSVCLGGWCRKETRTSHLQFLQSAGRWDWLLPGQSGWVLFRNTQKKIDELQSTIAQAIQCGRLSAKNALVLRGRMQFARGQIWGCSAKLCLSAVTAHAYSDCGDSLSEHAIACLVAARPREITAMWDKPMLLFTAASFNPDDSHWPCGLGGVLCNEIGKQLAAISISLTEVDLNILGYPLKPTVIFEAELLALVLCVKLWRKLFCNRPCVMYVDNNGTRRDVAISGSARSWPGSSLVSALLRQEGSLGDMHMKWAGDVFPFCDGPSRPSMEVFEIAVGKCEMMWQINVTVTMWSSLERFWDFSPRFGRKSWVSDCISDSACDGSFSHVRMSHVVFLFLCFSFLRFNGA